MAWIALLVLCSASDLSLELSASPRIRLDVFLWLALIVLSLIPGLPWEVCKGILLDTWVPSESPASSSLAAGAPKEPVHGL